MKAQHFLCEIWVCSTLHILLLQPLAKTEIEMWGYTSWAADQAPAGLARLQTIGVETCTSKLLTMKNLWFKSSKSSHTWTRSIQHVGVGILYVYIHCDARSYIFF